MNENENQANSFEDFQNIFDELITTAKEHGIEAMVILHESDPFKRSTSRWCQYTTGTALGIGLCEETKHKLIETALQGTEHTDL